MAVIIVKLVGLVSGLTAFGAYNGLKPKIGVWGALAASIALGVLVAVVLSAMLRA